MTYNLLQPTQADQFQLKDENLQEAVNDGRFDLPEINRFHPNLYIIRGQRGSARFLAALLFVSCFVITVPIWFWRWNNVGRILASLWLLGFSYLGYAFYVSERVDLAAFLPQKVQVQPRVVAADAAPPPEITLPTVTPTPELKRVTVVLTPVPLPTPTPSPVPMPTVTPWKDNPRWAVVSKGRLNMRAIPAVDAEIVGKLATKTCVEVITTEAEWLEVRQATGEQGWSASQFLEFVPLCPLTSTP